MQNIEYLSERDLKYFEKKEALGEAIIIRIEPEALLSLDLDALFQDHPKDQTLSAEELESFLQGNQPAIRQKEPDGSSERQKTRYFRNRKRFVEHSSVSRSAGEVASYDQWWGFR